MTPSTHWIVGPGALGRLIAHRLAGRVPVRLLGRHRLPARQTLVTPAGETLIQTFAMTWLDTLPRETPAVVHLTTKAYAAEEVHATLAAQLPSGVPLVLWQNGFACQPALTERHHGPVLCASTTEGAHVQADDRVTHAGHGHTYIGALDGGHTERAMTLARTLSEAGLPAEVVDDIRLRLWRKLAVNAAINPLVARFTIRNGQLRDRPFRQMVERRIIEVSAILDAEGVTPPGGGGMQDWRRLVWQVIEATANNRASMLQDVLAGRLTEHEAILAPLLAAASRHQLPAPCLAQHLLDLRIRAEKLAVPPTLC
ncbi:ketopantoate reductase family protein [Halomonas lysinitropha]|uniref:2-dehydropantoate 2-reductase n=1 Tax=Halomonas lysinitropha TaxID=2607506 RepID=A0A5K1I3T9_9GAMM|nr:2-dehydropantoate 2-reductase [Halomonas lysinitropha]VVZ96284.1 2-dehydropantoate 2-reductase [Halomonas lysinitropha]